MTIEEIMKEDSSLTIEFIYATRIVDMISKLNLQTECDVITAISSIERAFIEYKSKL